MTTQQPRMMIVDDNDSDVELVKIALEETGQPATLMIAMNGMEAIAQLTAGVGTSDHPRLVLLDLNMPGVSGHEVLGFIRSQAVFNDVHVVMLTSSMLPEDRARCMAAGANDYQVKPRRFAGYLELMHALFAQHVSRTQA